MEDRSLPNGIYTIENLGGEHRTFKIWTKQGGDLEGKRVIALLSGNDNENSYKAFGFANPDGRIYVWKKHQNSKHFIYFAKLLRECGIEYHHLFDNNPSKTVGFAFNCANRPYHCQLARRCMRCNRQLTDPESIRTGMGPTCRKM